MMFQDSRFEKMRWPLVGLFCLAWSLFAASGAAEPASAACNGTTVETALPSAAELVARTNARWAGLVDFEADLKIRLTSPALDFAGKLRQKGSLVRLDLDVPVRLLGSMGRPDEETETVVLSYDGSVFWQFVPMAGHTYVRKTDYRARQEETGRPAPELSFALPELVYRFSESEGGRHYRLETDDAAALAEAMLIPGMSFALNLQPTEKARVTIEASTLLPVRMEMLDARGRENASVSFEGIRVNQGIEKSLFTPEIPEGAFVIPVNPGR